MTSEQSEARDNLLMSLPSLRHVMETDWRNEARCAKLPKEIFFNYNQAPKRKQRVQTAKAVCRNCPVISKCYEFAVCNNEPHGIWAGTLPEERKKLHLSFRKTGILEEIPSF